MEGFLPDLSSYIELVLADQLLEKLLKEVIFYIGYLSEEAYELSKGKYMRYKLRRWDDLLDLPKTDREVELFLGRAKDCLRFRDHKDMVTIGAKMEEIEGSIERKVNELLMYRKEMPKVV